MLDHATTEILAHLHRQELLDTAARARAERRLPGHAAPLRARAGRFLGHLRRRLADTIT